MPSPLQGRSVAGQPVNRQFQYKCNDLSPKMFWTAAPQGAEWFVQSIRAAEVENVVFNIAMSMSSNVEQGVLHQLVVQPSVQPTRGQGLGQGEATKVETDRHMCRHCTHLVEHNHVMHRKFG